MTKGFRQKLLDTRSCTGSMLAVVGSSQFTNALTIPNIYGPATANKARVCLSSKNRLSSAQFSKRSK
ncbi:hypothetical protein HZS_6310 [Henneguya salminicola]|nr:hypothetical protein HZS_6310 [Henneguya salminicola]